MYIRLQFVAASAIAMVIHALSYTNLKLSKLADKYKIILFNVKNTIT